MTTESDVTAMNVAYLRRKGQFVNMPVHIGESGGIAILGSFELLTNYVDGTADFRITAGEGVCYIGRVSDRNKIEALGLALIALARQP